MHFVYVMREPETKNVYCTDIHIRYYIISYKCIKQVGSKYILCYYFVKTIIFIFIFIIYNNNLVIENIILF